MLGLGDDQDALGLDYFSEDIGRLGCQRFLCRRPAGENFDHPRQMRKTGDLVVPRNIRDMGQTEKGQEVMFAHGIERYVADNNQFIAVFGGIECHLLSGVLVEAGKSLFVKFGHPLRRLDQPFTFDILTDPVQNQADALDDFLSVNRSGALSRGLIQVGRLLR